MARLKNPKLSTLTPQQREFLDGLKTAPAIGPDEYVLKMKGGKHPKRKPTRLSHGNTFEPDESIKTLAMLAANWLADQWPGDVAEQGRGPFIAARYAEILSRNWTAKYWEEMPLQEETTRVGFPTCMLPETPIVQQFFEPDKQNTWCTYESTELATGDAGYYGKLDPDGYFRDKHHLEKHFLFTLPKPAINVGVRPLFSSHEASWQVTQQHRNVQPWCSLYKASTAREKAHIVGLAESLDKVGRYYYHKYHHPDPNPGGSTEYMSRRYTVDALYLSHDYGYIPDQDGVCLIQTGPAAIRGLYRYHSSEVTIQMPQQVKLYRAKIQDEEGERPTLNKFRAQTSFGNYAFIRRISPVDCSAPMTYEYVRKHQGFLDFTTARKLRDAWNAKFPNDQCPPLVGDVPWLHSSQTACYTRGNPTYPKDSRPLFDAPGENVFYTRTFTPPGEFSCWGDFIYCTMGAESNSNYLDMSNGRAGNAHHTGGGWRYRGNSWPADFPTYNFNLVINGTYFTVYCLWQYGLYFKFQFDSNGVARIYDKYGNLSTLPAPPGGWKTL